VNTINGENYRVQNIAVIGGGAWGTALAQAFINAGRNVKLWALEKDLILDIKRRLVCNR